MVHMTNEIILQVLKTRRRNGESSGTDRDTGSDMIVMVWRGGWNGLVILFTHSV